MERQRDRQEQRQSMSGDSSQLTFSSGSPAPGAEGDPFPPIAGSSCHVTYSHTNAGAKHNCTHPSKS